MNPLIRLVANALPGERKLILFAGVGVSKDADLPTAWELMLRTASLLYVAENGKTDEIPDIQEWFINSKYARMSYAKLISEIYSRHNEQRDFLRKYLNDKPIGEAHKLIAELARKGIIRAIITTNFDNYIERALLEKGLTPQVLATEDDIRSSEPLIHCKSIRIYKPHGDLERGIIKNTPQDLEKLGKLMTKELVQVINEHCVLILGYAGADNGILNVLKKRHTNKYGLFWANPNKPDERAMGILERLDCDLIKCEGASQLLNDILAMHSTIDKITPEYGQGLTMADLKNALIKSPDYATAIYREFKQQMLSEIGNTTPDFDSFTELDDAVKFQIENAIPITVKFIQAVNLACSFDFDDLINELYDYFGEAVEYCYSSDNSANNANVKSYDGFRFLVFEQFVSFVAILMKYNKWGLLDKVLTKRLFLDKDFKSGYFNYHKFDFSINSIDIARNSRLKLERTSLTADICKSRYEDGELSKMLGFKRFCEADYFLFMYSISYNTELTEVYANWCPRTKIYLDRTPSFIKRCESKRFFDLLGAVLKVNDLEQFKKLLSLHTALLRNCFKQIYWIESPLEFYDINKIASVD
ncbi:MAG: SIR2 family protein [Candidatus Zixiibacteriota bacterium]